MKSIVQEAFRRLEAERAAEAAVPWAELKISHKIEVPAGPVRRYIRKMAEGPLLEMLRKLQRLAEEHRAIVYVKRGRPRFTVHYPISFEHKSYYVKVVA